MLTRWYTSAPRNGSADLAHLRRQMERVFQDFDGGWMPAVLTDHASDGLPALRMNDTEDAISLSADLPGFSAEDLSISMENDTLTLRGERSLQSPDGYEVRRRERGAVSFARTVSLPCRVDAEGVEATLEDGVLSLRLPKAADEQPRNISVKTR